MQDQKPILTRKTLDKIPQKPGIYFFKTATGIVLYVGKAKNLKNRITSYFQRKSSDFKSKALLTKSATIAFKTTTTELEAMLLEAEQIQKLQPKFNVLLKDGQPFLYFFIKPYSSPKKNSKSTSQGIPELELVRTKKKAGSYFGPFIEKNEARQTHQFLLKTFKLALCKKKIPNGCLKYHLGLCAGSCLESFDKKAYKHRLSLAKKALRQPSEKFLTYIDTEIKKHNKLQEFEISRDLHSYKKAFQGVLYALEVARDRLIIEDLSQEGEQTTNTDIAHQVQEFLQLEHPISTIDCFDISHKQGFYKVGSCIRFKDGKPDKSLFRKFHIKTVEGNNDYASLQETVTRRYKNNKDLPDLVLIDGGKGQRNAVKNLFPDLEFVSLAKREERLFSRKFPHGKLVYTKHPVGKLFIELRDYAHHFAITFHRATERRKKQAAV